MKKFFCFFPSFSFFAAFAGFLLAVIGFSSCSFNRPAQQNEQAQTYRGGFYTPKTQSNSEWSGFKKPSSRTAYFEDPNYTPKKSNLSQLESKEKTTEEGIQGQTTTGIASWYGPGFHGKKTANGEIFNENALTVAHKTLPFGTQLKITNLENNKSLVARVNDRGPFVAGRILDGSKKVAEELDYIGSGSTLVQIQVLGKGEENGKLANRIEETPTITIAKPENNTPVLEEYPIAKLAKETNKKAPAKAKDAEQFIQIGAFSTSNRALDYIHQVQKNLNLNNLFTKKNESGYFRVLIGPLENAKEGKKLVNLLQKNGISTLWREF